MDAEDRATLELPSGETVTPEDVFLFNGYPYRFEPVDAAEFEFLLSPLYWGDSGMDIPFEDRSELDDQWGEQSRGTLTEAEWEDWLTEARADDRFADEELDAIAAELPVETGGDGVVGAIKDALGLSDP